MGRNINAFLYSSSFFGYSTYLTFIYVFVLFSTFPEKKKKRLFEDIILSSVEKPKTVSFYDNTI